MRVYTHQTLEERAEYFHHSFKYDIPVILDHINQLCKQGMVDFPEKADENWQPKLPKEEWAQVASVLLTNITTFADRLAVDAIFFAALLFNEKMATLSTWCLSKYNHATKHDLMKGIEYFFKL